MTEVIEETLTEEEKQDLIDNPKTWRVFVTKTITEEFIVDANTQEEAEYDAIQKAENCTHADGYELEDVTVEGSELDRGTYLQDEIDFLEEEVL